MEWSILRRKGKCRYCRKVKRVKKVNSPFFLATFGFKHKVQYCKPCYKEEKRDYLSK